MYRLDLFLQVSLASVSLGDYRSLNLNNGNASLPILTQAYASWMLCGIFVSPEAVKAGLLKRKKHQLLVVLIQEKRITILSILRFFVY